MRNGVQHSICFIRKLWPQGSSLAYIDTSYSTVDIYKSNLLFLTENEIDGEAFFLMTEEDIKDLIKTVASRVKLLKKRSQLMEMVASDTEQLANISNPVSQVHFSAQTR